MSIQRLPIKEFLLQSKGNIVLDVRSPGEYKHAQMPGATSFPLFTDEERKIVGTTYKQQSREQAIKIGLDMFGPKMRKMVEEVEALRISNVEQGMSNVEVSNRDGSSEPGSANCQLKTANSNSHSPIPNSIYLYCWRGGMRSAAVAWLLDLYGFKVKTLAGGYKAFRNHVLSVLGEPYPFKIVGGFTGSGKTEVLHQLEKTGAKVIDLEAVACHKGSAFGSFKMPPQPSQEMFENNLFLKLQEITSQPGYSETETIWIEDESQRIGNLNIPPSFWNNMRKAPVIFLEVPFEERLNHLTEEYSGWDKEKLVDAVCRISKRLGGVDTKNTLSFLENGEFKEAFRILLNYYDKRYLKGLHNREQLLTLLTKLPCKTVDPENAGLLSKYQPA